MKKSLFRSKTFWFNLVCVILAALLEVSDLFSLGVLTALGIPEDKSRHIIVILGVINGVINIVLRRITKEGVYVKKTSNDGN